MIELNDELLQVMTSKEFQKILEEDEVLKALDKEKNNASLEFLELMSFISKRLNICGIKVIPFTPVMVSFLYAIDNRFFNGKKEEIRPLDIDVVMYLLHHGIEAISENLIEDAFEFCKKHDIDYQEAECEIFNLIHLAFRPLEMWPWQGQAEQAHYNLDWLTKVCSIAAEMTNKTTDDIAYNMSLTEVNSYIIQAGRKNDPKGMIKRRNSAEIDAEMYKRSVQLGEEFLMQKKDKENGQCIG